MPKWSCEETKGQKQCRNPHGCHCAEIEALQVRLKKATAACQAVVDARTRWQIINAEQKCAAIVNQK